MYRILFFFSLLSLAACNNSATNREARRGDSAKNSSKPPEDSLTRVAKFSFIDGCMEGARITLGDQKAFAFCKCIFEQLKSENPGADSVELENLAQDTARIAKMAAACR